MDLKSKFRHVMDFPKEGIDFIDITTVLQDKDTYHYAMERLIEKAKEKECDIIVGPESRGFIFGATVAYALNKGFVPIRKKGKLPYKTIQAEYELEYGTDVLEMHIDAIKPGQKVLVLDDLLATGGTTTSNIELIEKVGGEVTGLIYLIELEFLHGRDKLQNYDINSIVKF